MAKIIQISEDVVSIGLDDGSIKEARKADLNFVPAVGDEVDVFENETKLIVSKKETPKPQTPAEGVGGGININVTNANNNNTGAPVYVANNTKAVNKLVYCLLAFFLGGIGVHKFYAGKTGTGILFLLFCWTGIPALIAFIDFIVGLCKKADAAGNILV